MMMANSMILNSSSHAGGKFATRESKKATQLCRNSMMRTPMGTNTSSKDAPAGTMIAASHS